MRRFVWLVVGLCLVLPVMAQVDSTPTPNPTETFTPTSTPTFTPTVTFTPSPTLTHTATAETTATVVPSVTPEVTQEVTAEVTEVVQPTVEATAEVTVEVTPSVVIPEVTEQVTEVVTESVVEITVEVTEPVVVTQEATAEVTEPVEVTAEITPEILYTATPGGIALRYVQGVVTYQNRPTSAGISVMVWSQADVLLSIANTNASGIYSVPVPSDEPYWLVFNGELHQEVRVLMEVTQAVPSVVLFGGDLDSDGCIGQSDLNILIANYDQPQTFESDINGDSITNLSDLAILTGNYQACDDESPLLPEENVTPEATSEVTAEVAPTETGEPESTEAIMDVTISPTGEATPSVEMTEEAAQP